MLSLNAPWNCVAIRAQKPRRLRGAALAAGSITTGSLETGFIGEAPHELRGLREFAQFYPKCVCRREKTNVRVSKCGNQGSWDGSGELATSRSMKDEGLFGRPGA